MQRLKRKIQIPYFVTLIHAEFKKTDKKLFLVGGCVRDTLLDVSPKDFDLATDATPDEIKAILNIPLIKLDLVGASFGVVIARPHIIFEELMHENAVEIATFRTDVGEGRRPDSVKFTTIEEDVKRRDLTINALFYDIDNEEIIDLVGGLDDIKNGIIRTVGAPRDRFREDPLRKLRAIRFAGRTGFELARNLMDSLIDDSSLLGVSPERIHDEFKRSIESAKNPKRVISMFFDFNFMQSIFPGIASGHRGILTHNFVLQVANILLAETNTKKIESMLRHMKYSVDEIRSILFLHSLTSFDETSIFKFKKKQYNVRLSIEEIHSFMLNINSNDKIFEFDELNTILAALVFELSVSGDSEEIMVLEPNQRGRVIEHKESINFTKFNDTY